MSKSITQKDIEKSVKVSKRGALVRSDVLSKFFNKQHKDVLKKIRGSIVELGEMNIIGAKLRQYFIEEKHSNQGGEYSRYQLTRKGFDLVALSLTGKKAFTYKVWYIDSFHHKQEIIEEHKLTARVNMSDDLWLEFRQEGKEFRNKLTKVIHDTVEIYRNEVEFKMNNGKYYYHYTSLIYSVLGIDLPKGTNPRDVLDKRMLVRLEDMEDKVADMIINKANKGIHYKEVYQKIKEELV